MIIALWLFLKESLTFRRCILHPSRGNDALGTCRRTSWGRQETGGTPTKLKWLSGSLLKLMPNTRGLILPSALCTLTFSKIYIYIHFNYRHKYRCVSSAKITGWGGVKTNAQAIKNGQRWTKPQNEAEERRGLSHPIHICLFQI